MLKFWGEPTITAAVIIGFVLSMIPMTALQLSIRERRRDLELRREDQARHDERENKRQELEEKRLEVTKVDSMDKLPGLRNTP
jgi:hypothetical protein